MNYRKYVSKDLVYAPKSSMDPWHVQQVEPQTLIMEKIIMEKKIMEKPVNLP